MKNSNVLSQPLCQPFECYELASDSMPLSEETRIHYFAELVFLREGRLRYILDREEITVSPGEAVLLCPGQRHCMNPVGEGPFRLDLLRIDLDRLPGRPEYAPEMKTIFEEALREQMPMLVPAPEARAMNFPELFARSVLEAENRAYGYDACVTSLMTLICLSVIRFWMERGLKPGHSGIQADPIYSLSGYIQDHLREGLRVEDLAAICRLSYPWFAKKFREIYGMSCKDYIERIRVARVEQFLMFTDMDLTRISEATGYADCSHMIKNFKRIREITPGQYRLKMKAGRTQLRGE